MFLFWKKDVDESFLEEFKKQAYKVKNTNPLMASN